MGQGVTELMELLRAFVNETALSPTAIQGLNEELEQVLNLARIHQILGIVAYKIREYAKLHDAESFEEEELFQAAEQLYALRIHRAEEQEKRHRKLFEELKKAQIDHLLFKGIAVKELYPVPHLRTFGDVDLVIRKEDRTRCHKLMQDLGYEIVVNHEPVYTYRKEKELYEIHTGIMAVNITNRADYIGYFQNLWSYAEEIEPHCYGFSKEFHFIYLLSHIAKHIYGSGAGIRMYLDLAFYIKRLGKEMDWVFVEQELDKLELKRFFHLTLSALNVWFDVIPPVSISQVEEDVLETFTQFTMEAGVFGYAGRSMGEQLARKAEMQEETGMRRKALTQSWFPSAKSIQEKYTYLKKHPYLLPIAWVDRLVRNFNKIGQVLENSKDILMVDENAIHEKNQFYRKIGL